MTPRLEGDEFARYVIRNHLDENLIVEASAGTGKTTELVNRIVAVLRAGRTTIDRIAAVTFTNKAAGELKVRLRQELDAGRAAAEGGELRNLEHAIAHLEEAAIGTIHAFCARVLRERPVEAQIDPAFEELEEREQQRIYDRAFRRWFERALEEDLPGLRRALSRLVWMRDKDRTPPSETLRVEGRKLVEWRDFRTPWRRDPFDRLHEMRELTKAALALARTSDLAARPNDVLRKALRPARGFAEWIERWKRLKQKPDPDAVEALLIKLAADLKRFKDKGSGQFSPRVLREDVLRERAALIERLEQFARRANADFAAELQAAMSGLIQEYEHAKQRAGKLDFGDLLGKVRDLVVGNPAERRYLQQRYTHFFIDEFQDTDPVQADLLLTLACGDPEASDWRESAPAPGKLFLVGDPKQSIYRFRRADVQLYQTARDCLRERGVRVLRLGSSFRASSPIQQFVNAAFAPEMQESADRGQAAYVALEGSRPAIGDQPAVVALPPPRPLGGRGVTKAAIDRCLPDATAAFIHWLLAESGWKVRAPGEEALVPIAARHIAVLFRRFVNYGEDLTRGYVRPLEARGIPHVLVGSKSFHQLEEIQTLRTALTAVEWPNDELSVYATLKGTLFAVSDNLLFAYRAEVGRLHPLRPAAEAPDARFAPIDQALAILGELHRARNERPVSETLTLLIGAARAHAGFAMRPAGHQVVANVYRLQDMARAFELTGGISFRAFVEELADRASRTDAAEAPLLEDSADGVRLMTVHTAKGLEFPVVILADMTAQISSRDPDRYLDAARGVCALRLMRCSPAELADHDAEERARDESEGVRVAYVAATRARDLLVVPAVGDGPMDGNWVSPLNKALYPPASAYRTGAPHPLCPVTGDRTVLPTVSAADGASSVRPGEHQAAFGGHAVVWWDPAALKLGVESKQSLQNFDVLRGDSPASMEAYRAWREERGARIERACEAGCVISNPTDLQESPSGIGVEIARTAQARERPYGPRFGTLMHLVLRDAIGAATPVSRSVEAYGRALGIEGDELDDARAAADAALKHPLLVRALASTRKLCEAPVSLRAGENEWIEGAIDLAFEQDGIWHVIDYKTDAPSGSRLEQYRRQVAWYGAALVRITGAPVRCYLLSV